mgnify:CR=1 FL=1
MKLVSSIKAEPPTRIDAMMFGQPEKMCRTLAGLHIFESDIINFLSAVKRMINVLEHLDTGPVSYTHLRAHETVLDIVCRLLLEKKKP